MADEAERWQEQAAQVACLTPWLAQDSTRNWLTSIAGSSPYLAELMLKEPELLAKWLENPDLHSHCTPLLDICNGPIPENEDEAMRIIRTTKRQVSLILALNDLAGGTPALTICHYLSQLADQLSRYALAFAFQQLVERNILEEVPVQQSGIFLLGMGKLGAMELNYSSDVDVIFFYDPTHLPVINRDRFPRAIVRMVQQYVRLMEERTADGYGFRTDLRLRPDPFSTPVILSTHAAFSYYESVGQNWERAAYIKARPIAGDVAAGKAFLDELRPFVWRKYLDYGAIQDIASIKRQIDHRHSGLGESLMGHNVKLGDGGIRDIELYVQTQQLIWGGRMPILRCAPTMHALEALTEQKIITQQACARLQSAYPKLRRIEHAIQMVRDQQTHQLPEREEEFARVAGLMGHTTGDDFQATIRPIFQQVSEQCRSLFSDSSPLAASEAAQSTRRSNLVFTGTDDDPETIRSITRMGYREPAQISRLIRQWHYGQCRATRSQRARELITELTPTILQTISKSAIPDKAFLRFDRFLRSLNTGVQPLEIFQSHPETLSLLAELLSSSERLAEWLSEHPYMIDRLAVNDVSAAQFTREGLAEELEATLRVARDREDMLNRCRQFANEMQFLIAMQLLKGRLSAADAGHAFSLVADISVTHTFDAIYTDFVETHGEPDDSEFVILAMGKWGSETLTFDSDLDVVFIYRAAGKGRIKLPLDAWYTRLAQRIQHALSTPMQYGSLFEVDVRLRPYGDDSALATAYSSFERYYESEAWAFEYYALTRARVICGHKRLERDLLTRIPTLLQHAKERFALKEETATLMAKIRTSLPPTSAWDVKHQPGGLLDQELVTQTLMLMQDTIPPSLPRRYEAVVEHLATQNMLNPDDADALSTSYQRYSAIQQLLRLCNPDDEGNPPTHGMIFTQLSKLLHCDSVAAMRETLEICFQEQDTIIRTILGTNKEAKG